MIAAQRFDEDLKSWHLCAAIASAANMWVAGVEEMWRGQRCGSFVGRTRHKFYLLHIHVVHVSANNTSCTTLVQITHTHTHTHTQIYK